MRACIHACVRVCIKSFSLCVDTFLYQTITVRTFLQRARRGLRVQLEWMRKGPSVLRVFTEIETQVCVCVCVCLLHNETKLLHLFLPPNTELMSSMFMTHKHTHTGWCFHLSDSNLKPNFKRNKKLLFCYLFLFCKVKQTVTDLCP